jgi:hypothetical protein
MILAVATVVAGALLAGWIFARYPQRAPSELRPALIHMGASIAVFYVARPLLVPMVNGALGSPAQQWAFLFLLVLPPLTYRFLSTIWLLNVAQQAARGRFS